MTARSRRRFWLKLSAGLLFAVVAYGGAYAVLVKPLRLKQMYGMGVYVESGVSARPLYPHLFSSTAGGELQPVFSLAHWIDRKIRPEFWGPRGKGSFPMYRAK